MTETGDFRRIEADARELEERVRSLELWQAAHEARTTELVREAEERWDLNTENDSRQWSSIRRAEMNIWKIVAALGASGALGGLASKILGL